MKVLIVDESRAMRMMLKRTLRKANVGTTEFKEAECGADALDAIDTFNPDFIFSEYMLPDMYGVELIQNFRAASESANLGIITSQVSTTERSKALEAGAGFYLTKPYTPEALEASIDNCTCSEKSLEEDSSLVESKRYTLSADGVGELLTDVFGREVTARQSEQLPPDKVLVIAAYARRNEENEIRGVILADAQFANFCGAALMLTPAAAARDNADGNKLPGALFENFQEVLRILGQLFDEPRSGAVWPKSFELKTARGGSNPEIHAFIKRAAKNRFWEVVVEGYGAGKISAYSM